MTDYLPITWQMAGGDLSEYQPDTALGLRLRVRTAAEKASGSVKRKGGPIMVELDQVKYELPAAAETLKKLGESL